MSIVKLKTKYRKLFSILILAAVLALAFTGFVLAQRQLEVEYPEIGGVKPEVTTFSLPDYVKYIFNFIVGLSGFIAIGILIYAGFRYLTSAGSPARQKDAKDQILAAILGVTILFGAYLILTTINPQLIFLNLPELEKCECEQPQSQLSGFCKMACRALALPTFSQERLLLAKVIPAGQLIDGVGEYEGVLAETRIKRISDLSEEILSLTEDIREVSADIQKKSREIVEASEKIQSLTKSCSCQQCKATVGPPRTCITSCAGDPCASEKNQIQLQQKVIQEKTGELPGLKDRLGLLIKRMEGRSEELGKESEKLAKAIEELNKARDIMKDCSKSLSQQGRSQKLVSYKAFGETREQLREQDFIKGAKIENLWPDIDISEDKPGTFYCAEQTFSFLEMPKTLEPLSKTESQEITETIVREIPGMVETESFCGPEIPTGQTIDGSREIGQTIIAGITIITSEIPKISQEFSEVFSKEILKEINDAINIKELPGQCSPRGCKTSSTAYCSRRNPPPGGGCARWSCYPPPPCRPEGPNVPCPYQQIEETLKKIQESHNSIIASRSKFLSSFQKIDSAYYGEIRKRVEGAYLCEGAGCQADWGLLTKSNEDIQDKISSFYISGPYDLKLWSGEEFKGDNICFTKSIYDLGCYNWGGKAQSIEILGGGGCQTPGVRTNVSDKCQELERAGKLEKETGDGWFSEIGQTLTEKLISDLNGVRGSLNRCVTSAENLALIREGEKALSIDAVSCKEIKTGAFNYYDKNSKKRIDSCYGPDDKNLDRIENYFCCETEISSYR